MSTGNSRGHGSFFFALDVRPLFSEFYLNQSSVSNTGKTSLSFPEGRRNIVSLIEMNEAFDVSEADSGNHSKADILNNAILHLPRT